MIDYWRSVRGRKGVCVCVCVGGGEGGGGGVTMHEGAYGQGNAIPGPFRLIVIIALLH